MGNKQQINNSPKSRDSCQINIQTNNRWFFQHTVNSNTFYSPFPLEITYEIEKSFLRGTLYDASNNKENGALILFDYEANINHLLIHQDDPWTQTKCLQLNIKETLPSNIWRLRSMDYSCQIDRITNWELFQKSYSNQISIWPYLKIFNEIELDLDSQFIRKFVTTTLMTEKNVNKLLNLDYNAYLRNKYFYSVNSKNSQVEKSGVILNFEKIKQIWLTDFSEEGSSVNWIAYIVYYLNDWTEENFVETMIKMFYEEGIWFTKIKEMFKNKIYKKNTYLIMYYLCLNYSLLQIRIDNTDISWYIKQDKNQIVKYEKDQYYYNQNCTWWSKERTNEYDTEIQIKCNRNTAPKFKFLLQYACDLSLITNIYNDNKIYLPPNSVFYCSCSGSSWNFIPNLLSTRIKYLGDKDKKSFWIYDDLSNIIKYQENEISTIKSVKIKSKIIPYVSKLFRTPSSLEEIDLYGCELGNQSISWITSFFNISNNITYLDLSGNDIGKDALQNLNSNWHHITQSLKYLNWSFNVVNDEAIEKIEFKYWTNLKHWILKENQITKKGAIYLASQLKFVSELLVLDLYYNKIENNGIIAISDELDKLKKWTKLDLFNCHIRDDGIIYFFKKWNCLQATLEYINLKHNLFGKNKEIVKLWLENDNWNSFTKLKYFSIEQNDLDEIDLLVINKAMHTKMKLPNIKPALTSPRKRDQNINIPSLKLVISSIKPFQKMVKNIKRYCYNLISLELNNIPSTAEFTLLLHEFASSVLHLENLKSLSIINCSLSSEDWTTILDSLSLLSNVTELNLSSNDWVDKTEIFTKTVSHLSHIEKVNLSFCNWDELFFLEILKNVNYLKCISYLDLFGNNINDDAVSVISSMLKGHNNITYLNLGNNNIGNLGISCWSDCLKFMRRLNWWDVSNNVICDNGFQTWIPQFEILISLERFDIRYNRWSDNIINTIKSQGIPQTFLWD